MKKYLFLLVLMMSASVSAQSLFDDVYYTPPTKKEKTQAAEDRRVAEQNTIQQKQNSQTEVGYEYYDEETGEFVYVEGEDDFEPTENAQSGQSVTLEVADNNIFNLPDGVYEIEVRGKYIYFVNGERRGMSNIYELNDGYYTIYVSKNSVKVKQNS